MKLVSGTSVNPQGLNCVAVSWFFPSTDTNKVGTVPLTFLPETWRMQFAPWWSLHSRGRYQLATKCVRPALLGELS